MSSIRKLLLMVTRHTKQTVHTCTTINTGINKILSHNVQSYGFSTNHDIISILNGCRSLKDCYNVIRSKEEYILLLNSDNSTYSYQHHKYFIFRLIERASKDKYLSWEMICNIIEFYSNFKSMYNVPIESIYNFLSILSRRGDFGAISSIMERLMLSPQNNTKLPTLPINNRIFCILIESLRIGGQSQRGYDLFEQVLHEFNVEPSITLLLNGYMCNPSKWKFNFILLLNEYHLQCDKSAYNDAIHFHLQCIIDQCQLAHNININHDELIEFKFDDDILSMKDKLPSHIADKLETPINIDNNDISQGDILYLLELHSQRVLFYLNHATSSSYHLNTDIFRTIIATSFDYILHNKLSSNNDDFRQWIAKYLKHILFQQLRNHTPSSTAYKHELSKLLPFIFEGCLHRNEVQLSRDVWQYVESHDIEIDKESNKYYNDLSIRHFVRHGKGPSKDTKQVFEFKDSEIKLSVFPGDSCSSQSTLSALPQPNEECLALAKNLLNRSSTIASLMDTRSVHSSLSYKDTDIITAKQMEPRSRKSFLMDMENAITFCRKYNDIISGRMLFQAFINSKLSFKYHAAMSTDFLFLLDYPQFRQYIIHGLTDNNLVITPKDVMTLWPLHPPQPFINKAFTILITYKNAQGIKKLFDTVTLESLEQRKKLSLSPKMLILGSDLFAEECRNTQDLMNNIYWDYLWRLMESKHFKSARTEHSVAYIGNKILNILFDVENHECSQDQVMLHVKRIHNTFKHYNLPLPLPLMQKLHSNLSDAMHKSWIRTVYIDEHHPDKAGDALTMHIMNDYRWYIDSELFNKSLEEGLYDNLKPLRKLMIDGTIPASHRLIHRILVTFSRSQHLYVPELKQFLIECQAHYKHAFSPKEKSLIVSMIKRYMTFNGITAFDDDGDVSCIVSYLQSVNINIGVYEQPFNNVLNPKRRTKSYLKYSNPKSDVAMMSDSMRFEVGETVQLCGLEKHSYLNGNIGTVVGWFDKQNRTYPVQLNDNPHIVYVSARNIRFGKHIINTKLPEFQVQQLLEADVVEDVKSEDKTSEIEITPFDKKQKRHHLRSKLLHIFRDQKADRVQNGISLSRFKELWQLYFASEEFYHDDESLHDYVVIHTPFEVDYTWNIDEYPTKALQRIYYLTTYDLKPKWHKLTSLNQFLSYLRDLIKMQRNRRIRLKDLCTACYADVYESHKLIRSNLCVNMLHFLNHHNNEFHIDKINGEKYISLHSNDTNDALDITHYTVFEIQYWLWKLYHDTKCNHNISISQWNDVLALLEGHHIDGNALIHLTPSDFDRMHIQSIGIKKLILSSIDTFAPKTKVDIDDTNDRDNHDTDDTDSEEPLFTETEDRYISPTNVLCEDDFYKCLMDYHKKFPTDDNCIYEHMVLEYYEMGDRHQWFVQYLIDYYYDKFHICYYDYNDIEKRCKINIRRDIDLYSIDDDVLQSKLKHIVKQHPIGIDIVFLLRQYELIYDRKMFQHNVKYKSLTDRLKSLNFIVTTSSYGYIVFDSYS